jgi:hypothetical protein
MPILNKNDSYHLSEKGPVRSKTLLDKFYDFSHKPYWLVSCFDGKSLRYVSEIVPEYILQEIRNNNIILCIGADWEVFSDIPATIYDHLIAELAIPAESILLLSANCKIDEVISNIAESKNLPKINSKWICVFERCPLIFPESVTEINTLQVKEYPKKFLSLNRRWRACRLSMISHLKIRNLLGAGFVSLQEYEGCSWDNSWEYMMCHQDEATKQLFEQHKNEIMAIPEMKLDSTDSVDMPVATKELDSYYVNSYFSIVGGSIFYEREFPNAAMLCEKTFKAIEKKHPFILMSTANNLPFLHTMGYKTFDGLIDESYDKETDDNKRMLMIVNEVERLCNLSESELETFLIESRKIVEHNFENLIYRRAFPKFSG